MLIPELPKLLFHPFHSILLIWGKKKKKSLPSSYLKLFFVKQDFDLFIYSFFKAAGFVSKCNCIPRKFAAAATCRRKAFSEASESFILYLFELKVNFG